MTMMIAFACQVAEKSVRAPAIALLPALLVQSQPARTREIRRALFATGWSWWCRTPGTWAARRKVRAARVVGHPFAVVVVFSRHWGCGVGPVIANRDRDNERDQIRSGTHHPRNHTQKVTIKRSIRISRRSARLDSSQQRLCGREI